MGRTRRLRYRHLRRTIIAGLATVAAFLLVVLIARMLLTAGPTRRLAREWIQAVAEQRDLAVEIDDLSWGFIPPRLHLEGVRLEGPAVRAEVETAEVDLARIWFTRQTIELGTVAADGVKIALDGAPLTGDRKKSKLKIRVRQLDLTRVEFVGTDMPGRIDLALAGMNVGWSSEDGPPTGFLRVDSAGFRIPGLEPFNLAVAARVAIDDGIQLPYWTVSGDGIALSGRGTIGGGTGTSIAAGGDIDLGILDGIVKAGGILSGTIDIDSMIQPGAEVPIQVEVRSDHLEAAGFPLDDVAGRLVFADGVLRGDLDRATFFGGRLNGVYSLTDFGGSFPHTVRVNGRGVEVAEILRSLGISSAGIASVLDTDVEIDWNGSAFPLGHGRARTVFNPTEGALPASGPLLVELKGDRALSFSSDELQIGNSVMSWQGPLEIGTWQPSWSVTATPAVLEEIVPMVNSWIGSEALPAVEGSGRLQVSLSGPWQELVVNARLDARPLRWGPIALDHVVTNALIGGKGLTLEPSRFSLGDGSGEIEGSLTWDPSAGDEQLALDLRGHRLPIATIAEWAGLEGMADGAFSFTGGLRGALGLPRGSWAAGLADVAVAGLDLGDATATIDLADGRFEARGLDFDDGLKGRVWWQVADGEVGTDLSWDGMPLAFLGDHRHPHHRRDRRCSSYRPDHPGRPPNRQPRCSDRSGQHHRDRRARPLGSSAAGSPMPLTARSSFCAKPEDGSPAAASSGSHRPSVSSPGCSRIRGSPWTEPPPSTSMSTGRRARCRSSPAPWTTSASNLQEDPFGSSDRPTSRSRPMDSRSRISISATATTASSCVGESAPTGRSAATPPAPWMHCCCGFWFPNGSPPDGPPASSRCSAPSIGPVSRELPRSPRAPSASPEDRRFSRASTAPFSYPRTRSSSMVRGSDSCRAEGSPTDGSTGATGSSRSISRAK